MGERNRTCIYPREEKDLYLWEGGKGLVYMGERKKICIYGMEVDVETSLVTEYHRTTSNGAVSCISFLSSETSTMSETH